MGWTWSFSGTKRSKGYQGNTNTYEYLLSPTLLQRNLMHLRNHPNDPTARGPIPDEILADLETWFAKLPETWWVDQAFYDRHGPKDTRRRSNRRNRR